MDHIEKAAYIIKKGGVIIFPTDTIFGIGTRVGDIQAINRLYKIKARKARKPTIILAKDLKQASTFAYFNEDSIKLAKSLWPGPLTLILRAKKSVPEMIKGSNNSVGVRVPNYKIVQSLIEHVGEPILAPSANFQNETPPSTLAEIDKELIKLVDYVLELECGGNKPSTIVEIVDSTHRILRQGTIGEREISKILKE